MADSSPSVVPLPVILDRLTYEAQYVRDVLFLAGEGPCHVSSASMQRLYDGLAWVIAALRTQQPPAPPAGVSPAVPAPGG